MIQAMLTLIIRAVTTCQFSELCRKSIFSAKMEGASTLLQRFAYARTETLPFIFGKVDLPRPPMHLQLLAPDKLSKEPPLNL
jgi:hypothetical protein